MREIYDEMYHYDFSVRNRETFEKTILLEDDDGQKIDLSGKSAAAQVRPEPGSSILTASMSCTLDTQEGSVTMLLTSDQTAAIAPGKYAYDLCLIEAIGTETVRKYILGGVFAVFPSVTA